VSDRPDVGALLAEARRWRDADPDPVTAAELDDVIGRAGSAELAELFDGRLGFGTAGLRGPLGPGPRRMNRLLVRQSAAGLARALREAGVDAARRGVVVAHDARHGSADFAEEVTATLCAHGIAVHRLDGPAPTPLAAFALRHLGAAAAAVVTASHNPASDNGLKVYWGDGAQIVPPVDGAIAAAILAAARDGGAPAAGTATAHVHHLGGAAEDTPLVRAYTAEALGLVPGPPARPVPLAVTSLHGVGADLLDLVLRRGGHGPVHHVESQRAPDPDFPTVAFPNPEEPGAMDLLLSTAAATGATLAIANDPDADRVALAAEGRDGRWRALGGDETGALLAHHLLSLTDGTPDRLLATTVVSSRLLGSMCAAAGAHFAETLTGFKWLCRPAMEHPGWTQVMTYEEALGYAVGPSARDKDGITAALVAADLAATLAASGATVWDVLDDLARAHGAHVTANGSVRLSGPGWRPALDARLERVVDRPPSRLGGIAVEATDQPAPDVLRLHLADRTRVVVRPSGTEPKLKHYCEAIEAVAGHESPDDARQRARYRAEAVVDALRPLLTTDPG
jgi:phosphomannomutase